MPAKPLPPVLYKYYPPARTVLVEDWTIRFTSPNSFNDTFDSDYLIPKSSGPKARLARARHRILHGVFCLTEDPTSHVMWVHYAAGHTGFVVGFNTADEVFSEKGAVLDAVEYTDDPMPVVTDPDNPPLNIFFQKSTVWNYEKEWRCVRKFDAKESHDVMFLPPAIGEIIIGSAMEDHQVSKLLQYADASNASGYRVEVKESVPVRRRRNFECEPTKRVHCTECGGKGHIFKK